jgi:NAD(P)-dependent dehydrogenase (short-subunit alcohol dehydrogenase family)
MKNILITGASGNVGKAAVEKFLTEGHRVIATVTPGKGLGYETKEKVFTYEADLTNEKDNRYCHTYGGRICIRHY